MGVYSTFQMFKASKPLLNAQDIAKPRHHARHHGSRDSLIVDFVPLQKSRELHNKRL